MDKVKYFIALALFVSFPLVGLYVHWLAVNKYVGQRTINLWLFAVCLFSSAALVIYYGDLFLLRLAIAPILRQGWTLPAAATFSEIGILLIIPATFFSVLEVILLRVASQAKILPVGQGRLKTFVLLFLANTLVSIPLGFYWLVRFAREIVSIPQ